MKKYMVLFISLMFIFPKVLMAKIVQCDKIEIEMEKDTLNIDEEDKIVIHTKSDYTVNFKVKDEDIVSIDKDGNIKALKNGKTSITIGLSVKNGETESTNCNATMDIEVVSSNSKLKSLDIEEYSLKDIFKKSKLEYEITLPYNVDKINITAEAEDSDSKISGIGRKYLEGKGNTFLVVVTASDNSTTTYKIIVNREDANKDSYLKSLVVEGFVLEPKFDKNTYKYTLSVDNEVDSIKINATPSYEYSIVEGAGEKNLATGSNEFNIVVKAENGNETKYEIDVNKLAGSCYLKSLSIKDVELNEKFDKDKYTYTAKVYSNIDKVEIDAKASSDDKVEVFGNDDLKYGENTIIVRVSNEEKSNTTYKIIINKINSEQRKQEEKNNKLVKVLLIIFIISIAFMSYFIGVFIKRNYKNIKRK